MGNTTIATPVSGLPTLSETSLLSRPSQQPKLTKKQKKAIAFRRDKSKSSINKRKSRENDDNEEGFDQMENLHGALVEKSSRNSDASNTNQMATVEEEYGGSTEARSEKAGAGEEGAHNVTVSPQQKRGEKHQGIGKEGCRQSNGSGQKRDEKANRKRKREDVDNGVAEKKGSTKKRKGEKDEFGMDGVEEEGEGEEISESEGEEKKTRGRDNARFILFIGNLKYTTSVDSIKAHFSTCDPPPQVRLLTPKSSSAGKTSNKSKGCAFLEFARRTGLQQALKLHHSTLEGRMINVELTAGGGGKGEKRMEKLRERNKVLLGQRQKKPSKNSKESSLPSKSNKPQRYSATSGMEQSEPGTKRTWTVGDVTEDEPRRGGKKHKKGERTRGSRTKSKDWATGVNAIPVS